MQDNKYPWVTVEGKNTVVIGGTSGIGRAIALGMAEDGADVIATSRDEASVSEIATEIRNRGRSTTRLHVMLRIQTLSPPSRKPQ